MPEPLRPAKIHGDEGETHDDRGDREKLAEDHEVVQLLVAVDVNGDHQHHGGGGDAHEEGEVRDVNAPRDLVGHAGRGKTLDELVGIGVEADETDGEERANPSEVAPVALEDEGARAPEEDGIIFDRGFHASK